MKTYFKIAFSLSLALVAAACATDTMPEPTTQNDEQVNLTIVPSVVGSQDGELSGAQTRQTPQTRAVVIGTGFHNTSIGIGLHAYAPVGAAPAAFFGNVEARNTTTSTQDFWSYYPNGVNNGEYLSGFRNWGGIEVRGYYPYDPTITDIKQIPFTIAENVMGFYNGTAEQATIDRMVARTMYKDMTAGTPALVALQFEHLMTAIEIDFWRSYNYPIPHLFLDKVDFELTGGREFTVAGTYTADNYDETLPLAGRSLGVDPARDITATETTDRMTIDCDHRIIPTGSPFYNPNPTQANQKTTLVILPQLRVNGEAGNGDGRLTMTFYFSDTDGQPYSFENIAGGNPKVSFLLSSVTNPDTSDTGLLAGYRYRVRAQIQTYTNFVAPTSGYPSVVDRDLEDDDNITDEDFIEL